VVFSHDWLTGMRGGERVLETMCQVFPSAPIYTLIHNPPAISSAINAHTVKTSFLQHFPGVFRYYRNLLPLFPAAVKSLRPPSSDLVMSMSHCIAKGLHARGTPHLCYCFTPMRYAWLFHREYFGGNPLKAIAARPVMAALRRWDFAASRRVTRFVAISENIRERVKRFYGREADVVYPPVDTERCTPGPAPTSGTFDLIVSALVPYKRLDLAVRAYARSGYPLKIVGTGTELQALRALAGPNTEFQGWRTDEEVLDLYRGCRMLVFPGEEDFGIVPVEAQACGKPVVAYARGGILETVVDGTTGVFFREQTEDSLLAAVSDCASRRWDPAAIRNNAERFSTSRFLQGIAMAMRKCLDGPA